MPPVKGEVRARMKALFKYRDAEGDGIAWYRLTDLVRGTLQYADLDGLYRGLEHVVSTLDGSVRELNDRYQAPLDGGYRDIQLVVEVDGHLCELQLSTEPMLRAKKTTGHRDFEVVRELKAAGAEGNLDRVINALEFGREHLGSNKGEGAAALSELLRQGDARTLMHDAAARGHAEIVHAMVLHGADVDATDGQGDTPLHHAVYSGHERCVWVLLNVGHASLDIQNADGQTALVKGYTMLWQRPPEAAQRAVSTLAQMAGPERVSATRAVVDAQIQRKLKQSRVLVDHAADGDAERMLEELRRYAHPDSKRDRVSALAAALAGGHADAVELLLNFNASLQTLPKPLPPAQVALLLQAEVELEQLLELGVSAKALREAGCPPEKMKAAGYTATKLLEAGYGTEALVKMGCTLAELCEAGCAAADARAATSASAAQLREAGYTAKEQKQAGCSAAEMVEAGCALAELRDNVGVRAAELLAAGVGVAAMREAGYTVRELHGAGVAPTQLQKEAGCMLAELRKAGVPAAELLTAGVDVTAMRELGYTVRELHGAGVAPTQLREGGFLPRALSAGGIVLCECYSVEELVAIQEAGVMAGGLYAVGGRDGSGYLSSVEQYDAAADAWTPVASMGSKRVYQGVAALDGGSGPLTVDELLKAGATVDALAAAGFAPVA